MVLKKMIDVEHDGDGDDEEADGGAADSHG